MPENPTDRDVPTCPDCRDVLRAGDDVLCAWCEDNHRRHPEDYGWPAVARAVEALAG